MTTNASCRIDLLGNRHGCTELHEASCRPDPRRVASLIGQGARHEASESFGLTPLHWACAAGQAENVRILLAAGADPKARSADGELPLAYAYRKFVGKQCRPAHVDCAYLIFRAQGVQPGEHLEGRTLREYFAACQGHDGVMAQAEHYTRFQASEDIAKEIAGGFAELADCPAKVDGGAQRPGKQAL